MREVLLPLHIATGGFAIVLGAVALIARKGGWLHRRAGRYFVYAMLAMGSSGAVLALRESLTNANVVGGVTVVYFVTTALATVQRPSVSTRIQIAALAFGVAVTGLDVAFGVKAYTSPHHALQGVPFVVMFVFAAITGLAVVGDIRVMRSGFLRGGRRLARHLWRMCFALFMAVASFFSIRARVAKILPEPFTTGPMRTLPILLVLVAMAYWLWRVRRRGVVQSIERRISGQPQTSETTERSPAGP